MSVMLFCGIVIGIIGKIRRPQRAMNEVGIVFKGKESLNKERLSFLTRAMKEVTANILKLEQDNCSKRSMFFDKCYVLTINIQMLSLCCEHKITIYSETIYICNCEKFKFSPCLNNRPHSPESGGEHLSLTVRPLGWPAPAGGGWLSLGCIAPLLVPL